MYGFRREDDNSSRFESVFSEGWKVCRKRGDRSIGYRELKLTFKVRCDGGGLKWGTEGRDWVFVLAI